jgi:hypothetical protein
MADHTQQWLQHYLPIPVLRAADVLADHADFWEEEALRGANGQWRERTLTQFIRSGLTADRRQCARFKQLLAEYVELSMQHPPKEEGGHTARARALGLAVAEARRWLKKC